MEVGWKWTRESFKKEREWTVELNRLGGPRGCSPTEALG